MKLKVLPQTIINEPTPGKLNIGGASFNTIAMKGMKKQQIRELHPDLSDEQHEALWAAVSKGEMPEPEEEQA